MRPLIIYHASCSDGFGAAWWLGKHIGVHDKFAGRYGDPPPDCTDRDVYIVDFCYPGDVLDRIAAEAMTLLVLDHHQTAAGYLADSRLQQVTTLRAADFPYTSAAVLDTKRSGVGIVSAYVHLRYGPMQPPWLGNIEDRDLWQFTFPDTPAVFAAVTSRPYTVEAWDEMDRLGRGGLVAEGEAICRYRDKLVESTVETAFRVTILGHEVWCAASPYAIGSDVAGYLAKCDPGLFAAYFVWGSENVRFGLRSAPTGMDVAALAETVGGGGHRHASGFGVDHQTAASILAGGSL